MGFSSQSRFNERKGTAGIEVVYNRNIKGSNGNHPAPPSICT
jgi:hypothetical protein